MHVGTFIRSFRLSAGLTQAQLARRMGTTQSAIARLEGRAANPTVSHLERALRAAGQRLELRSVAAEPSVDETLLRRNIALPPSERIRQFEAAYGSAREIARAGARSRGDLA